MATATTQLKQSKMTAQEVADFLGISIKTLWRWHDAKKIPAGKRLGGDRVIRWDPAAIEKWFHSQPPANK